MPVKSVCAWGSGRIAGIKSNRTPHSGGPLCSAGSVCIHVVLSVRSSRSVSLCLLWAGECIRHCFSYVGWPCLMPWPQKPLLLNQTRVPKGQGGTPPSGPMEGAEYWEDDSEKRRHFWMDVAERKMHDRMEGKTTSRHGLCHISSRWKRPSLSLWCP